MCTQREERGTRNEERGSRLKALAHSEKLTVLLFSPLRPLRPVDFDRTVMHFIISSTACFCPDFFQQVFESAMQINGIRVPEMREMRNEKRETGNRVFRLRPVEDRQDYGGQGKALAHLRKRRSHSGDGKGGMRGSGLGIV